MAAGAAVRSLDQLAQAVYDVVRRLATATVARRGGRLKESEFLTLALLHEHGTLIVGEIQRELGVLPAQMSRIIRALENRDPPFIRCAINPGDKRKIDVRVTPHGQRALEDHRRLRMDRILAVLNQLEEQQVDALAEVLDRVREIIRAAEPAA